MGRFLTWGTLRRMAWLRVRNDGEDVWKRDVGFRRVRNVVERVWCHEESLVWARRAESMPDALEVGRDGRINPEPGPMFFSRRCPVPPVDHPKAYLLANDHPRSNKAPETLTAMSHVCLDLRPGIALLPWGCRVQWLLRAELAWCSGAPTNKLEDICGGTRAPQATHDLEPWCSIPP